MAETMSALQKWFFNGESVANHKASQKLNLRLFLDKATVKTHPPRAEIAEFSIQRWLHVVLLTPRPLPSNALFSVEP